jgi:hypothetical protein
MAKNKRQPVSALQTLPTDTLRLSQEAILT